MPLGLNYVMAGYCTLVIKRSFIYSQTYRKLYMIALWYKVMLWIRILSDPKLLAGSGCGSGKIIPDPGRS
jgi:hypothetical protein